MILVLFFTMVKRVVFGILKLSAIFFFVVIFSSSLRSTATIITLCAQWELKAEKLPAVALVIVIQCNYV